MQTIKRFFLRLLVALIAIGMVGAMLVFFINSRVKSSTADQIRYLIQGETEISAIGQQSLKAFGADCALVLGCGIADAETPSPMLKDRLDAGIALYQYGIVPKLLLSGDNGQENHNELHVMLKYTREAGIPEEDIFCDHAGFSTYDSVYRAQDIFEASRMIIVTQQYHEYRALYLADKLGLAAVGVASDQETYFGQNYREAREILARNKDFFKVLLHGKAQYGGEVIPISGSGISSHAE